MNKARQDWSQKALSMYGPSWVYGAQEKVHQSGCHLTDGAHQDFWSCFYEAAPCKWVEPQDSDSAPGVKEHFRTPGALPRRR